MRLQGVTSFLKRTRFCRNLQPHSRLRPSYLRWLLSGKGGSPPHIVKQKIVKEYAKQYNLRVFVETGTCGGDMVNAVKDTFQEIHSIEIGEDLYQRAKSRFSGLGGISIHKGDSADILPVILDQVKEPVLFWLDAHYSGGGTARGELDTPVVRELGHILAHRVRQHVILVDDARCFVGEHDYPTMEELQSLVQRKRPGSQFEVKDDIIRIHVQPQAR